MYLSVLFQTSYKVVSDRHIKPTLMFVQLIGQLTFRDCFKLLTRARSHGYGHHRPGHHR